MFVYGCSFVTGPLTGSVHHSNTYITFYVVTEEETEVSGWYANNLLD